jgi:hypothetical protein
MKKKGKTQLAVPVEPLILTIRGRKVILDSDLAGLYGVSTKRLNEQVRRNAERFPDDFAFRLSSQELTNLRSQIATSSLHGGRRHLPWAFTEHGAIMAANVLNSSEAVAMSVYVVRAFVRMREEFSAARPLSQRLSEIERILLSHDVSLRDLYEKIRPLLLPPTGPPKRGIGFHVREPRARYAPNKRKSPK